MDSRFQRSGDESDASVRGRVDERIRNPADAPIEEVLELLQDGYAHALDLEGERRRLSRELAELRVDASDADRTEQVRRGLRSVRAELRELRSALKTLRAWVEQNAEGNG
jgi:hypothetical protein